MEARAEQGRVAHLLVVAVALAELVDCQQPVLAQLVR
jgi:hypothetical protein